MFVFIYKIYYHLEEDILGCEQIRSPASITKSELSVVQEYEPIHPSNTTSNKSFGTYPSN